MLQFNRKTENFFKEFIWFFFCRGGGGEWCGYTQATLEIYHRWTLLSAKPKFSRWKKF